MDIPAMCEIWMLFVTRRKASGSQQDDTFSLGWSYGASEGLLPGLVFRVKLKVDQ